MQKHLKPLVGYELAIERVRNGRYGTAFGGKAEIGMTIESATRTRTETVANNVSPFFL